jgi:hypothetical protein
MDFAERAVPGYQPYIRMEPLQELLCSFLVRN